MYKIKFLIDYTVKDSEKRKYKAGQIVSLSQASCEHFVSRGVAVMEQEKRPELSLKKE